MNLIFALWQRKDTIFHALPVKLFQKIIFDADPNSDIAKVLHHAAYARKDDVDILLYMIAKNPRLLLLAGNVITPGGDEVRQVTPDEFCLGAGDFELAKQIEPYFANIPQGEIERFRQFEAYKPHIEGMLTQKPYNIRPLISFLKKASKEDVKALLSQDMTRDSLLCKAIIQYKKDHGPRIITNPEMHYNYQNLYDAVVAFNATWTTLIGEKKNLLWRLLLFK